VNVHGRGAQQQHQSTHQLQRQQHPHQQGAQGAVVHQQRRSVALRTICENLL
jgi:hypothetical protein